MQLKLVEWLSKPHHGKNAKQDRSEPYTPDGRTRPSTTVLCREFLFCHLRGPSRTEMKSMMLSVPTALCVQLLGSERYTHCSETHRFRVVDCLGSRPEAIPRDLAFGRRQMQTADAGEQDRSLMPDGGPGRRRKTRPKTNGTCYPIVLWICAKIHGIGVWVCWRRHRLIARPRAIPPLLQNEGI